MNIMLVDDEILAIHRLAKLIGSYEHGNIKYTTQNPEEVIQAIVQYQIDIIFLDINMPEVDGLKLAKEIKGNYPERIIVFVTGLDDHAVKAFELEVFDYLLKPVRKERLEKTMSRLMKIFHEDKVERYMEITTFSEFNCKVKTHEDIMVDIKWRTKKMKELFAYLVDNYNKKISRDTIIHTLWREFSVEKANKNLSTNLYYLRKELSKYNLNHLILSNKENIIFKIDTQSVSIDFMQIERFIHNDIDENIIYRVLSCYVGGYLNHEGYLWSLNKRAIFQMEYEKMLEIWLKENKYNNDRIKYIANVFEVFQHNYDYYFYIISQLKKNEEHQLAKFCYDQLSNVLSAENGELPQIIYEKL